MCYVCVGCGKCETGVLQTALRQRGRCLKCGTLNPPDALECKECGAKFPPQPGVRKEK